MAQRRSGLLDRGSESLSARVTEELGIQSVPFQSSHTQSWKRTDLGTDRPGLSAPHLTWASLSRWCICPPGWGAAITSVGGGSAGLALFMAAGVAQHSVSEAHLLGAWVLGGRRVVEAGRGWGAWSHEGDKEDGRECTPRTVAPKSASRQPDFVQEARVLDKPSTKMLHTY